MGFCLLYEGMLDSVLKARDMFLKEGGMMFPSKAKMFIAAIDDSKFQGD
jgi:protein arginine N-methyltransferase 1